jgi:hypothetical protein
MMNVLPEQLSSYLSLIDQRLQGVLSRTLETAQGYLSAAWYHPPAVVPYLPLIATTAAALVCLMLFMSMKVQLRSIQARLRAFEEQGRKDAADEELAAAARNEKAKIPPDDDLSILANLPKAGLDQTARSKVLRMHRAGQSSEEIAASLRMPKGEVDLLVKVHEIELGALEQLTSA